MGCLYDCVKCTLIVLNTLTTLAGLALIGFGAYIFIASNSVELPNDLMSSAKKALDLDPKTIKDLLATLLQWTSYVVFSVGGIIFFISLVGCCGAMFKARCPLITYATIMLLLAAVKIFLAVALLTSDVKQRIEITLAEMLSQPDSKHVLNIMESQLQCCGTYGSSSYTTRIPATCCPKEYSQLSCPNSEVFRRGCVSYIIEQLVSIENPIEYGLFGLAILELLNMIAAIYLCFRPKKQHNYTKIEIQKSHGQQAHSYPAPSAPYVH